MEIVKLKPAIKNYIWGGKVLKKLGKESEFDNISECWELSFHSNGKTLIDSDKYNHLPLSDVATMDDIGTNAKKYPFFPILIKLIDSADNLSIQVHPSDEYALKNENSLGKTEMWYILDAKEDGGIYVGFNKEMNEDILLKSIENNTIIENLNFYKVKTGDCFFIPPGTIHAIGKNVTLLEIQENSNLTYRLYDYNRVDNNGNKRPLHISKALEVLNYNKYTNQIFKLPTICNCKYFTSYVYDETNDEIITNSDSFATITIINGTGKINDMEFKIGDTFFIPTNKKAKLSGKFKYVLTKIN